MLAMAGTAFTEEALPVPSTFTRLEQLAESQVGHDHPHLVLAVV